MNFVECPLELEDGADLGRGGGGGGGGEGGEGGTGGHVPPFRSSNYIFMLYNRTV